METLLRYKWQLVGLLVGALGGFLYWKYVGCLTGTCAITSSPVNSTLYFAFMGMLLPGLFQKSKTKTQDQ